MEIAVLSLAGSTLMTVKADPSSSVLDIKDLISVQQAHAHPVTWLRLVLQGRSLDGSDRLGELPWVPAPAAPAVTLIVVPAFEDILFSPVAVARRTAEVLNSLGDAAAPYVTELFADERFAGSRLRVLYSFRRIGEAESLTSLKALLAPYALQVHGSGGGLPSSSKTVELFEWLGYATAPLVITQLARFQAAKLVPRPVQDLSLKLSASTCPPCVRACAVTFFELSAADKGVEILRGIARELGRRAEAGGGETRRGYPALSEAISSALARADRQGGKATQKRIDALKHLKAHLPWIELSHQGEKCEEGADQRAES